MSAGVSYLYSYRKVPSGEFAIEIQRLEMAPPFAREFRRVATVKTKREAKAITRYRANHGQRDWTQP